jgi:hypothetical protein
VHADSKVGKTTLGSTCPKPLLILDAEGGSKFLPLRKIDWDGHAAPPVYDGTWDACVVIIRDFETLTRVKQWMDFGQHHFKSILVDSISEIQRRCKAAIQAPTEMQTQQFWGQLLVRMDEIIRGIRDLTLHPTNPLTVAMFIAETRINQQGKWTPYMQGQIAVALPYWMDIVGYLYVQQMVNADGTPSDQYVRQLLVTPHPQYEAGERVQGRVGPVITNPNIETILAAVYPAEYNVNGATA